MAFYICGLRVVLPQIEILSGMNQNLCDFLSVDLLRQLVNSVYYGSVRRLEAASESGNRLNCFAFSGQIVLIHVHGIGKALRMNLRMIA